jgi:hypothetical protein
LGDWGAGDLLRGLQRLLMMMLLLLRGEGRQGRRKRRGRRLRGGSLRPRANRHGSPGCEEVVQVLWQKKLYILLCMMCAKGEEVPAQHCGDLYSRRTLSDIVISESVDNGRVDNHTEMVFTVSASTYNGCGNHRAVNVALPGFGTR